MTLPPGTRVYRLLRASLPATVSEDVLGPAVADLQYEAAQAQTTDERRQIILRGYVAIVRALVLSIDRGGASRTVVAISALCWMGALLVATARSAHVDGRLMNSAMLAPGMLAPVTLRLLGTTSSRALFAGSVLVSMLTVAGAGDIAHAALATIVFAPLAAAAAIVARPGRETPPKRTLTAVSLGSGVATAVLLISHSPEGQPLSVSLAMTPFYIALFAVLFALTLLPLLLMARAFVTRPAVLAIVGLLCSPAPLIAGAYIDHGTVASCLDDLRRTPVSFAAWSLPFITGAIAVGWRLSSCGAAQDSMLTRS
jgi:hypothetical protein